MNINRGLCTVELYYLLGKEKSFFLHFIILLHLSLFLSLPPSPSLSVCVYICNIYLQYYYVLAFSLFLSFHVNATDQVTKYTRFGFLRTMHKSGPSQVNSNRQTTHSRSRIRMIPEQYTLPSLHLLYYFSFPLIKYLCCTVVPVHRLISSSSPLWPAHFCHLLRATSRE